MNHLPLQDELLERVLARLGFSSRPEPTVESLRAIYAAWCRSVPFDNVRKLIRIREGIAGPFPGSDPVDFFEAWLQHGTGGTCWSGAGSFHALLSTLGFEVVRGVATMMVAPDLPPNHGTVQVSFGPEERYLVDGSMLYGEPLLLDENEETSVVHPAWGVRCTRRDGKWHVAWRPLHMPEGLECRLDYFGASAEEYGSFYEKTRPWSPFNYELSARLNQEDRVVGASFGQSVIFDRDGSVSVKPIAHPELVRLLVEELGMSEEIAARLPVDLPTPPPPGSKTHLTASSAA